MGMSNGRRGDVGRSGEGATAGTMPRGAVWLVRAMDGSFNQERVQSDIDLQLIFMGNSVSFYGTPILV